MLSGIGRNALTRLATAWTLLAPGLFCLAEPSWQSLAWAAQIKGGQRATLGGLAAAYLHDLVREPPTELTCWIDPAIRLTPITHGKRAVHFKRGERTGRGEPRRTGVEQTLIDSASEADADTTVSVATRAFATRRTTPERVLGLLARTSRVAQRSLLTELCNASSQGLESALEWRFDQVVLRAHGLPLATRQLRLDRSRLDLVYTEYSLIIELDGRRDHDDWSRDMMRDNRHALRGMSTLRFGWRNTCFESCAVASLVRQALLARGWSGKTTRCPRCP